jgi:hypothetical protein
VGVALNRLVDEFAATLTKVHALVDRIVARTVPGGAASGDQASESEIAALVSELDATMEFFRVGPSRTIREDGD